MARARNIKPSFFKNELLGQADPMLGLLFISLWTLADKSGRLEDRPLRIKAETFPYRENININGYLTELVALGFIDRYKVGETAIIEVINFTKHQTPHSTEKASELPCKPIDAPITLINASASVISHINVLIPESLLLIPDSITKVKKLAFVLPDWINKNHWDAWHLHPKRKKLTDEQKQLAVEQLFEWKEAGIDYELALKNSATNNWQGLFEPNKQQGVGKVAYKTQYQAQREKDRDDFIGEGKVELNVIGANYE